MTAARQRSTYAAAVVVGALILVVYPFVIKAPAWQNGAVVALIFASAAVGWNLLGGYMGQLSFGHGLFFGIGAYTTGYLVAHDGVSPWLGILAGAVLASAAGWVIGFPMFRLRSHYFSIATIAMQQLVFIVVVNTEALGAATGLTLPIKPESLANLRFSVRDQVGYHLVALGLLAVVTLAAWVYVRGRAGMFARAIRDDEEAALASGVPVRRYKLYTMALSAAVTALAGGMYAMYVLFVDPSTTIFISVSITIVVMAILGGAGTFWGPLLGALVLTALQSSTRIYLGGGESGGQFVLYGLLIAVIVLLEPLGLIGIARRIAPRLGRLLGRPGTTR